MDRKTHECLDGIEAFQLKQCRLVFIVNLIEKYRILYVQKK